MNAKPEVSIIIENKRLKSLYEEYEKSLEELYDIQQQKEEKEKELQKQIETANKYSELNFQRTIKNKQLQMQIFNAVAYISIMLIVYNWLCKDYNKVDVKYVKQIQYKVNDENNTKIIRSIVH